MSRTEKALGGKVIFVRSNLMDRDTRLAKEMAALSKGGHTFGLLCWDRECKKDKPAVPEGCQEIRVPLRAPWGVKCLPFLPLWWCLVLVHLLKSRWDVVHAVNLTCIPPSIVAARLKRKPVVYEILDIYEGELPLPKVVWVLCLALDRLSMRLADAVIVADEAQIEGVGGVPNSRVVPIYDSPPEVLDKAEIALLSSQRSAVFTIFHVGSLAKAKRLNLDKLVEAIRDIEGVKLAIGGYGDLEEEIKEWCSRMPDKVEFLGKIAYEDVIKRGVKADLFFILRDPIIPVNKYTCGSTLFNAMICGRPILANKGSSTALKVRQHNCGLVVDANNIEEIREAIIKLRDDPELCERLGTNGRLAYDEVYGWEIMGQRLVALYEGMG